MLSEYIRAAMRKAKYEKTDSGRYFGSIPLCQGCWAEEASLEVCRDELQSTLEDWLLLGLQLGHRMPVIEGIDLNSPKNRLAGHAQTHKA